MMQLAAAGDAAPGAGYRPEFWWAPAEKRHAGLPEIVGRL